LGQNKSKWCNDDSRGACRVFSCANL